MYYSHRIFPCWKGGGGCSLVPREGDVASSPGSLLKNGEPGDEAGGGGEDADACNRHMSTPTGAFVEILDVFKDRNVRFSFDTN